MTGGCEAFVMSLVDVFDVSHRVSLLVLDTCGEELQPQTVSTHSHVSIILRYFKYWTKHEHMCHPTGLAEWFNLGPAGPWKRNEATCRA